MPLLLPPLPLLPLPPGRLDAEVLSVTRRVGELLQKLPRDINPVNLEELRRIKQALVELENKVGVAFWGEGETRSHCACVCLGGGGARRVCLVVRQRRGRGSTGAGGAGKQGWGVAGGRWMCVEAVRRGAGPVL